MKVRVLAVFVIMSLFITACNKQSLIDEQDTTIQTTVETTTATSSATTTTPPDATTATASATTSATTAASMTTTEIAATTEVAPATRRVRRTTAASRRVNPTAIPTKPPTAAPVPVIASPNPNEVVGVWISYIELSTVLTGKSAAQFRQSFAAILDNCRSLGINTVYVHLRPFGDALYQSDHFPWSKYATWSVGKAPDFDPLKVMLEETGKRNISFHGWLNPMRLMSDEDMKKVPQSYAIGKWYNDSSKKGKYIVKHGSNWYLNPAYSEVRELIGKGANEITRKYNVDGIHIDDYFYPTTANSFDADAFKASPLTSRSQFRLNNINSMVRIMYSETKKGKSSAQFGISPQGSIENNYDLLYADVEAWCKTPGYADYIVPQFYYGFNNSSQPYVECINRWHEMLKGSKTKLMFGLAVYKVGLEDEWAGDGKREWITASQILRRQILEARKLSTYNGVVFFSYNSLFNPPAKLSGAVQKEIAAFKPIL